MPADWNAEPRAGSPGTGEADKANSRSRLAEPHDVAFALDPALVGRFAEIAAGRVLVVDYLVTRPSPALPTAELSVRLQRTAPRGSACLTLIEGIPCHGDPVLLPVLREAGPRLRPVAGALLGQLAIDLDRPLVWLDFLSSTAARRD